MDDNGDPALDEDFDPQFVFPEEPVVESPEPADPGDEADLVEAAAPAVYDVNGRWRVAGRLGVGTDTPAYKVDVRQNVNGAATISLRNKSGGSSASARLLLDTSGRYQMLEIRKFGPNIASTWSGITLANWARIRTQGGTNGLILTAGGADPLILGTNDTERVRVTSGG